MPLLPKAGDVTTNLGLVDFGVLGLHLNGDDVDISDSRLDCYIILFCMFYPFSIAIFLLY